MVLLPRNLWGLEIEMALVVPAAEIFIHLEVAADLDDSGHLLHVVDLYIISCGEWLKVLLPVGSTSFRRGFMVCDQLLLPAGMLRYRSNASSPDRHVIDLGKILHRSALLPRRRNRCGKTNAPTHVGG